MISIASSFATFASAQKACLAMGSGCNGVTLLGCDNNGGFNLCKTTSFDKSYDHCVYTPQKASARPAPRPQPRPDPCQRTCSAARASTPSPERRCALSAQSASTKAWAGSIVRKVGASACIVCPKGQAVVRGHSIQHCTKLHLQPQTRPLGWWNGLLDKSYQSYPQEAAECQRLGFAGCGGVCDFGCNGLGSGNPNSDGNDLKMLGAYRLCKPQRPLIHWTNRNWPMCTYTLPPSRCALGAYGESEQINSQCKACSAGKYSAALASICINCPVAKTANVGQGACSKRPAGLVTIRTGSSACISCPIGKTALPWKNCCTKWDTQVKKHCKSNCFKDSFKLFAVAQAVCSKQGPACSGVYNPESAGVSAKFYLCKLGSFEVSNIADIIFIKPRSVCRVSLR